MRLTESKLIVSLFLGLTILFSSQLSAQELQPCGMDHIHEQALQNEEVLKRYNEANEYALEFKGRPAFKKDAKYIIPVVFHVIHIGGDSTNSSDENVSDQQIFDMMETVNEDFQKLNADTANIRTVFKGFAADSEIEFRLAKKDPEGNCTNGITRRYSELSIQATDQVKNLVRWNVNRYLNVWVVESIGSNFGTIAGYSNFPWMSASTDGIVMRHQEIRGGDRTFTHEIGHYFGLLHTFQGGCGSSCSNSGDFICDTPPTATSNSGCNTNLNSCSNDNPNLPDQIENYMDYSNCQYMFSQGQVNRMHSFLENTSSRRNDLWQNSNLIRTGVIPNTNAAPIADFVASRREVCLGGIVRFTNQSCNSTVDDYDWEIEGANSSTSTLENPIVTFTSPGWKKVTLTVSNSIGSNSITKAEYIYVREEFGSLSTPIFYGFEEEEDRDILVPERNYSGYDWQYTDQAAIQENSSIVLRNNLIDDDYENSISFTLKDINLSAVGSPELEFMVAYNSNGSFADRLDVLGSLDCGENWVQLENFFSIDIESNDDEVIGEFLPENGDDWKKLSVDLDFMTNSRNASLRFRFTPAGEGNNIYIDDLSILSTTGIESLKTESMAIYPQPASDQVVFNANLEGVYTMQLYTVGGKLLYSENKQWTPGMQKSYNLSDLNIKENGIYLIQIFGDDKIIKDKLVIQQ